ncbi:MAG: DegT/DnrJ/EryC1/StrS family aminotransferase [Desulfobacterales bacterium]|nr:DegT/DnrJ/EryC1/StrS family aminotransferase [Desulfobacterales bacterium]
MGPGDEVIIPSFVCSALLNAVAYTGAVPVPADIDAADAEPGPAGRRAAPVAPHAGRRSCRTCSACPPTWTGSLGLGVPVIEDCAQSHRAPFIGGRPVGSCGQAAVFSFYATKVIATGEGGMVATASAELAARGAATSRPTTSATTLRPRFNYKLTDIQAAVGRVQLRPARRVHPAAGARSPAAIAAHSRACRSACRRMTPGTSISGIVLDIGADVQRFHPPGGAGRHRLRAARVHPAAPSCCKLDGFPTDRAGLAPVRFHPHLSLADGCRGRTASSPLYPGLLRTPAGHLKPVASAEI